MRLLKITAVLFVVTLGMAIRQVLSGNTLWLELAAWTALLFGLAAVNLTVFYFVEKGVVHTKKGRIFLKGTTLAMIRKDGMIKRFQYPEKVGRG